MKKEELIDEIYESTTATLDDESKTESRRKYAIGSAITVAVSNGTPYNGFAIAKTDEKCKEVFDNNQDYKDYARKRIKRKVANAIPPVKKQKMRTHH